MSSASVLSVRRRTSGAWTRSDAPREIVYRLLLAFWFTIPWQGVIRIGGSATVAKAVGGLVAAVAVAGLIVSGRRQRINDFIRLLLAFAAWVVLSLLWTVTPSDSLQRVGTMIQLVIMVLLTWEFAHTRRRVAGLMYAWVAGATVLALVVVSAWALGQSEARYTAPGTNPNQLSCILLLAVPIAWYLGIRAQRRGLRAALQLYAPLACLGTALTGSRGGLLTAFVALLIIPLTWSRLAARARMGVSIAVVACLAGAVALVGADSAPIARLGTTSSEISSGTLDHRSELWVIALRLIGDHPILGLGTGGSKLAVGGQFAIDRGVHDTFLSIAVELGIVGLALFLLLGLSACYRAVVALPWLESRLAWVLTAVLIASLIPLHLDYDKSTYAMLVLLALLGDVFATGLRPDRDRSRDAREVRPARSPRS